MASGLTWKLPLAIASFMASTFSALNTSLPAPLAADTAWLAADSVTDAAGKKLRHYFDVVVKQCAQRHPQWKRVLEARRELDR